MAFDFSTLVTDRTQQDVAYAQQLAEKLVTGTATEAEIAEWNSFTLKGVYNHTDLNRVTAAMDALKAKLEGYGYAVPGYQRIKINHNPPPVPSASRLPEGYTELAYIQSSGTQYIDTGFKPNQSTKVVMDLAFTGHHSSHPFAFGARDSTGKADFYAYINGGGTLTAPWAFVCGSILNQHTKTGEGRQAVSFGNDGMIVNGVSASVTAVTFQSTVNLWLFCANRNGATQYLSSLKLYSCQIYDNGTLVRDYVPCINPDGAVGLYDLVTAAFFGNSGTGTFVAGDRVNVFLPSGYTRLTYIESTGTQYVDTSFKPNQNTRIVADIELISPPSNYPVPFGVQSSSSTQFWVYVNSASAVTANWQALFGSKETGSSATGSGRQTIDFSQSGFSADAVTVAIPAQTFQCNYSLWLCGHNSSGSARFLTKVKYYSCQIYDNDTLVRDYIPCINPDGAIGLYDLVTAAFFGNSGTGSFVAGAIPRELPDGYTQVEYIQSSGTQYVETGVVPKGTLTMKATVLQPSANAGKEQTVFGSSNGGIELAFSSTNNRVILYSSASAVYTSPNSIYDIVFDMTGVMSDTSPYKRVVLSLDGGVEATSTTANKTGWRDGTVTLFALNGDYFFTGKLYCASIYDDDVLVRDFVPCKNASGVLGLFDLANDVFYQNAGSGAFSAGYEVASPVTAAVEVVSNDLTEYDPYTWYEFDWPTPQTMTIYLLNVSAIRAILDMLPTTPKTPDDMELLTWAKANDIEQILFDVETVIYRVVNGFPRSDAFTFWSGNKPLPSATSDKGRTWEEQDAMNTTWYNWQVADWYLLLYGNLKAEGVIE